MNQKPKLRLTLQLVATCLSLIWLVIRFAPPALAESLSSDSFLITFGNFNVTSGEKSGEGYILTDTVGQTGAGPYGEYGVSGYFLGGGFQYIYQIQYFSFNISKLNIDLGTLSASDFNTDFHTLGITTRGASGYAVYAYEGHPLRHEDDIAAIIDDTICDSGNCDEETAGIWTTPGNGGFGFNAFGDDVPSDFISENHYRQFANVASTENMQIVMSSDNIAHNAQATITYQAGLSGSEAAGNYQTYVVYVAVPGY